VLNLLKDELPCNQLSLLELGPKFVPTPKSVPHMDIITNVENAVQQLERKQDSTNYHSEQIRDKVSNALSKFINFKPKCNLSSEQRHALKEIKSDKNIKVIPFDKGSGFAVMNKDDMLTKMKEQIPSTTVITEDPTNALVKKFQAQISKLKKR
jgi:hypothetical protein